MISRSRRIGPTLLLACAAMSGSVRAEHELPPHAPAHDIWRLSSFVDDSGLAGTFAMQVAFDDAGVVWIASANGLVRYDGYTWDSFGVRDGLPSDFVRCVTIARDGTIWVGTDAGLARGTSDGFQPEDPPAPFANIRRIVEDPDGAIWICADTWRRSDVASGLARWHEGAWTVWHDELPDESPNDVVFTEDGRFFLLARTGLYERVGPSWVKPLAGLDGEGEETPVWKLVETRDGLVAATWDTLYRFDGAAWSQHPVEHPDIAHAKSLVVLDGVAHTYDRARPRPVVRWTGSEARPLAPEFSSRGLVEYARAAPDGSIWFVGYHTVTRWSRDAEWTAVGLPPPSGLDAAGSLWFVGADGSTVRTGTGWHDVPQIRGRTAFAADGTVWSWQGSRIAAVTPGRPFEARQYATEVEIRAVVPGAVGGPWAIATNGTPERRVAHLDGDVWRWRHPLPWPPSSSAVSWSSTPDGDLLLVLREERHERLEVLRVGPETVVSLDAPPTAAHGGAVGWIDGSPWAWGSFGVWRRDAGVWHEIADRPARFALLVEERASDVWIVSDGSWGGRDGVSILGDGRWTHLDDRINRDAGRGPDGTLYFVDDQNAIAFARPGATHLSRIRFPGAGSVRSAWGDAHGDVWVEATSGVYRYCPDGVPPETYIDRSALQFTAGQPITPRVRAVERYRPRADRAFEYSWRLDGGAWSPYAALADGLELPVGVGRRELAVRARDEGGDIDPDPAVATVEVLPRPLQSRAWFVPVVLAVTLSIALLAATLSYSRYQLRRQARGLQRTVVARTRDLRETSALLRTMFDHIPFDVWTCDAEGRYVHQNLASRRRWGDLVGNRGGESYPAAGGGSGRADRHRRALRGETVTRDVRYVVDGAPVDCISVVAPIRDDDAIIGLVGIDVDVSEQRRAERQLRDSRHRFRRLAEASPSIIVQFDATANPTYINHRWATLAGRSRGDARRHGWWDSIDEDDRARVRQSLLDSLGSHTPWQQEFRIRNVDGRAVWMLAHGVPIRDGDRRGLIGVCLDITDRRELDDRRRRLANELDHRVKNNLAWVLSLITLTRESSTSVGGFARVLSSRVHALARTHECLAAIRWRGMGIEHLVRDALSGVESTGHVAIAGPDVTLDASVAGPLALCLHELATNAVKHGALARPGGRIEITWERVDTLGLKLSWEERFRPTPQEPAPEGVGLDLVRGLVGRDLCGSISLQIERDGVACTMTFPSVRIAATTEVKPLADEQAGPVAAQRERGALS